jgi:hypothetical protein
MYLHNLVHPVSFFSSLSSSYLPYLSPINKKRAEGKETAFVLETGHHPGMGWDDDAPFTRGQPAHAEN